MKNVLPVLVWLDWQCYMLSQEDK